MAQAQSQTKSATSNPLQNLVTFTAQTAGLEKTLRLIQSCAQVVGFTTSNKILATQCLTARDQLALGRRYFRLLDFYACFARVNVLITNPSDAASGGILSILELAQFTFLGLYLFLEDFTILHDMNVVRVEWYTTLMTEANKFWFYALVLSITRCIWEIFFPVSVPPSSKSSRTSGSGSSSSSSSNGKSKSKSKSNGKEKHETKSEKAKLSPAKWPLVKKALIDVCDLTLPGSFIGWVPASGLQIGLGMVLSTVLAGHNVWLAQGN